MTVALRVFTVGHSSREAGAFIALLAQAGVTRVVDIRTVPRSRFVPWADADTLPTLLANHGFAYTHLPALGGRRRPRPDSVNDAWESESFRGYADHMQTEEFQNGLDALLRMAAEDNVAIMCAEAVPWRFGRAAARPLRAARGCHRSLVTDALLARDVEVQHILDDGVKPAQMTAFARVRDGRVTYPKAGGVQQRLL